MLDAFILANRETLIARARSRVRARDHRSPTEVELADGIPEFLDQLGVALRLAKSTDVVDREARAPTNGDWLHRIDRRP
jgi:hypothetical protein